MLLTTCFPISENGWLIRQFPDILRFVKLTVNEGFLAVKVSSMPKNFWVALSIYTSREGQYEIKKNVTPHNETDTGIRNKNVVTFEKTTEHFCN